ncbi:sugar transferase [Paracoccus sp. IB05]|nr:sugar transferase [Paracoccus sp. IB05]
MNDVSSAAAGATASSSFSISRRIYRAAGKRVLDILIILCLLPIILPVILLLALLVMRDGGAPFFGHRRIGRNGEVFRCWKIRSMVSDSQERLRVHLENNPEARAEWNANFKLDNDPRITRFGRFLRKSSLDELPQIWNILKGEMSLVGPRPVTAKELDLYGAAASHYMSMRPGLTGLWQVSGRNDVSYSERVVLDVAYARKHNLIMDIRLILATVAAVLNRTGK